MSQMLIICGFPYITNYLNSCYINSQFIYEDDLLSVLFWEIFSEVGMNVYWLTHIFNLLSAKLVILCKITFIVNSIIKEEKNRKGIYLVKQTCLTTIVL